MRNFRSAPEPEGEVDFTIGADGRRVDLLPPPPLQQRLLNWVLWACGVGMVLSGTYSQRFSAALLMAAALYGTVAHYLYQQQLRAGSGSSPGSFRRLMSAQKYKQRGRACTEKALVALRKHVTSLNLNGIVRDGDSELRLRRSQRAARTATAPPRWSM